MDFVITNGHSPLIIFILSIPVFATASFFSAHLLLNLHGNSNPSALRDLTPFLFLLWGLPYSHTPSFLPSLAMSLELLPHTTSALSTSPLGEDDPAPTLPSSHSTLAPLHLNMAGENFTALESHGDKHECACGGINTFLFPESVEISTLMDNHWVPFLSTQTQSISFPVPT